MAENIAKIDLTALLHDYLECHKLKELVLQKLNQDLPKYGDDDKITIRKSTFLMICENGFLAVGIDFLDEAVLRANKIELELEVV